jgi:DNA-binding transcriptional LysR family regulator
MKDLSFDDLQLYARVAMQGTLSAVARERDVPVSQISRALSRIEKACGARLVHRSTHGLALTVEGTTFLDYCQRISATVEELEGEFAVKAAQVSGLVRVAASSVIAQYQLLPSLHALRQRHPQVRVDLIVGDQLVDMARDGIDIAIRTSHNLPDTVVARQLGVLGRSLYATPDYLARAGTPQHPDDLHGHRLISNSAVPALNQWPFVVDGKAVTRLVQGDCRTNDTGLAAAMVLQGLGIGRLGTAAATTLVAQKKLVPVLAEFVDSQPVPIYAVTGSARLRLPKIKACIDFWADWFSAPPPIAND